MNTSDLVTTNKQNEKSQKEVQILLTSLFMPQESHKILKILYMERTWRRPAEALCLLLQSVFTWSLTTFVQRDLFSWWRPSTLALKLFPPLFPLDGADLYLVFQGLSLSVHSLYNATYGSPYAFPSVAGVRFFDVMTE